MHQGAGVLIQIPMINNPTIWSGALRGKENIHMYLKIRICPQLSCCASLIVFLIWLPGSMKWKLCSCCVTRGEREMEAGAAFAADEVLITKAGSIVCFKARLPRIRSIFHYFSAHLPTPTHWFGSCVQILHRQMRISDIIIICRLFCLSFGNTMGMHTRCYDYGFWAEAPTPTYRLPFSPQFMGVGALLERLLLLQGAHVCFRGFEGRCGL